MAGLLGHKIGMTQIFDENGLVVPVTIVQAGPCYVTQIKNEETDGYKSIQISFDDIKEKNVTKPRKGIFDKAKVAPKRYLKEFAYPENADVKVGDEIKVDIFKTGEVVTTIDLSLQNHITSLLKKQLSLLKDFSVHNAAALVVNNLSSEVLAYIGSSDFFAPLGQNDGVLMRRSPGSALKPFIYAKALDEGLITPKKKLFDIHLFLPSYIPQNFIKKFTG